MSQRESRRVITEGYLHHRPGLGWVVDDVQPVFSDSEVKSRAFLEITLRAFENRRVRVVMEDMEKVDVERVNDEV